MSDGQSSDEVAENYRDSLEYLVTNDRYTINNLTVIAKENTEHAQAISKALEEHIRRASPERKLPALYVLDSIVKNIGSPYTLFLGHNLYNTFMDAYSLVDSAVRKKLDEMLKTWKNPVPGSLEKRPVFPLDITKRIESALIQARTVALQQHQQQQRRQHQLMMGKGALASNTFRNTPTPPQNITRYPPPNTQGYMQHHPSTNGNPYVEAQARSPYPPFTGYPPPQVLPPIPQQPIQPYNTPQSYAQPNMNIESLHRDIENLISVAKADFAYNVHDTAIQARLKALLDLQTILRSQQLPPNQIQLIREQVAQLSNAPRAPQPSTVPAPPVVPIYSPPPPMAATPNNQPIRFSPPAVPVMPSAASLAELLASAAKSQHSNPQPNLIAPPRPTTQQELPISQPPQVPVIPPQSTINNASSLLASLRAAGLIPNIPNSNSTMPTLFPAVQSIPAVNSSQVRNDVELTSASVKKPRPHLISKLYEARPNQCSTCGKRFLNTEEDKKKKARHLDWHFRANIRLSESTRKVHSRSWYVDEMEWIRSRGNEEEGPNSAASGGKDSKGLGSAAKDDPKLKFIPVPSDSALANAPCSICQEKFEPSWNDEAQDFVWMDAIKIGNKVYHASCHAEITKDGANTPRLSTPESVLGKRKPELSSSTFSPAKLRKENIS